MAGSAGLSDALADMPDTNVSMAEKPAEAMSRSKINAPISSTKLPNRNTNNSKPERPIRKM